METLHLVVLILHVLTACLLVGVAAFALIIVLKAKLTDGDVEWAKKIMLFGKPLSALQLILGFVLVGMERDKFAGSPLIAAKFVLFIASGIVSVALVNKKLQLLTANRSDAALMKYVRFSLLLLLLIIVTIVALGVIAAETTS